MIKEIYWVAEILAIIICIHNLFGQKVKINIPTALFIIVDLIYMNLMDKEIISRNVFFLIYVAFIIYNFIEFKNKFGIIVIQSIITIAIISIIQMLAYFPCSFIENENILVLIINIITLAIVFLTRNTRVYKKIFELTTKKDLLIWICISGGLLWLGYCIYQIRMSSKVIMDQYITGITFILAVICIALKWQNEYYEKKRKEKQMEMTQVYNDALNNLIETTRKNQHDYKNHLLALQSMNMTADSPEELRKMQSDYYEKIEESNKYTKILNCINHPILAGFIFYKLSSLDESEISVHYDVSVEGSNMIITAYDLNEIIGILLDNAIEAVNDSGLEKEIRLEVFDDSTQLRVCVKNISRKYTNAEMERFFTNKYSTKGMGRGIGLTKIKDYQKRYKFDILMEMCVIDDKDWLSISIIKDKS